MTHGLLTFLSPWPDRLTQPWFTAGLGVNIIFLWALVIQRANTGFQGFKGTSFLKCLHYFLFISRICQLHTLLPTLQIKFQLLFPWLQHSSLPSDSACCFFFFFCHNWPSLKFSLLLRVCLLAFLSILRMPVMFSLH